MIITRNEENLIISYTYEPGDAVIHVSINSDAIEFIVQEMRGYHVTVLFETNTTTF